MQQENTRLLRSVQEQDFTLIELNLFLDTHPDHAEALAAYRAVLPKAAEARARYESCAGPLLAQNGAAADGGCFAWVKKPWPWEKEAN